MTTETIIEKETRVSKKTADKIQEPTKFKVIVCNDDVTPIEFVVSMLMSVFKHDQKSALELTLAIHNTGSAVAGIFRFEIAEQKAIDATNLARSHGWPLIIKVEQE
jgi:ATP-dependent Clp protease adaptor protein ClpS